jgi:hypothetical protein
MGRYEYLTVYDSPRPDPVTFSWSRVPLSVQRGLAQQEPWSLVLQAHQHIAPTLTKVVYFTRAICTLILHPTLSPLTWVQALVIGAITTTYPLSAAGHQATQELV